MTAPSRRKLWIGALVAIMVASVVVWNLIPPAPGITEDNYYRLPSGMTVDEACKILGNQGNMLSGREDERFMRIWHGDGFITASFESLPDRGLRDASLLWDTGGGLTLSDEEKGLISRLWRTLVQRK